VALHAVTSAAIPPAASSVPRRDRPSMESLRGAAAAAAGLLLPSLAAAQQTTPSMNPCHGDKPAEASSCTRVEMPSGLCAACPLKPVAADGKFVNCAAIFDLGAPGCKGKFEEYVKLNPCDARRKELVEKWDDGGKERLEYFAYALCEQCCDTVEKGSKVEEFAARSQLGTLWTPGRGNGPAHIWCTSLFALSATERARAPCSSPMTRRLLYPCLFLQLRRLYRPPEFKVLENSVRGRGRGLSASLS
jgi:hypothetical protein